MANALIAIEGDSRSTGNPTNLWPLATVNYARRQFGIEFNYLNNAVAGYGFTAMEDRAAELDTHIIADVANVLIVWCGVNDYTQTAEWLYTHMEDYCAARQAAGWYVMACTEIGCHRANHVANDWNTVKMPGFNTYLRNNWETFADRLVDLGAISVLTVDTTDQRYFDAEYIHPRLDGARAVQTEMVAQLCGGTPAVISLGINFEHRGITIDETVS